MTVQFGISLRRWTMAKKRIFRQQLRTWREPQALHMGDIEILHVGATHPPFIDIWFEDNHDRHTKLPPLRNFKVVEENDLVPPYYTYFASTIDQYGRVFLIYREDQDE